MRLLLADASWPLYLPLLRKAVRTDWEMLTPDGDPGWLAREIPAADAILATTLPRELRPAARNLKALLYPGAGVVHHDPDDLPLGCRMCNVFEHEAPIAEYVIMTILMHATGIGRVAAAFRQGRWEGSARGAGETHGEALGATLGLVGYGHIAKAIEARAAALGMKVIHVRRGHRREELHRLLQASDFVVITCPLTPETRGLIGPEEIAQMRPQAYLVNPARAEIVDEKSLYEALRDHGIAGAALDVWYRYPETVAEGGAGSTHPFHELSNVLPTPHFSAWTAPMLSRRAQRIAENLDRLAQGKELERVVLTGTWTPERGTQP